MNLQEYINEFQARFTYDDVSFSSELAELFQFLIQVRSEYNRDTSIYEVEVPEKKQQLIRKYLPDFYRADFDTSIVLYDVFEGFKDTFSSPFSYL